MKIIERILMVIVGLIIGGLVILGMTSGVLLFCGMRFYKKDPNPPSKYIPVTEQLYRLK